MNRQLLQYRQLMGSDPTHLDSHQHVHRHEPVRTILRDIAQSLSVPLREHCPAIRYCGSFYGQGVDGTPYPEAITVDNLVALVRGTQSGFTELGCHPGVNEAGHAMYRAERAVETAVLSDGRVRAAIEEERITLTSFHTVPVP